MAIDANFRYRKPYCSIAIDGLGTKDSFWYSLDISSQRGELMVINWLSFSIGEKKTGHSTNDKNMVVLLLVKMSIFMFSDI